MFFTLQTGFIFNINFLSLFRIIFKEMRYIFLLFSLCCSCFAFAQTTPARLVQELATPSKDGAVVNLNCDTFFIFEQGAPSDMIRGYRVRIYFDNGQSARAESEAAQKRFAEMFPDIPTYIDYTAPYFKVTAGDFLTREEAIILWGRVLESFPTAFVVSENFPVQVFGEGMPMSPKGRPESVVPGEGLAPVLQE